LLRALAKDGRSTLSDLALRVGMPPSSAHRLLATLESNDLVEFRSATQEWMVGVEAFRIGNAFIQRNNLIEVGLEVMQRLVDETGETANLAIAHQGEVVFISQVETPNPIRAFFSPGTRVPMHASGIGKALLAELGRREIELILQDRGLPDFTPKTITAPSALFEHFAEIRRRGWAMDDEEHHFGMRCIAAPIYNAYGKAVAGVSISGPVARISDLAAPEMAAKVTQAAAKVTALTGGKQPERSPP
jgi:IclR family acetate operon transcriptional repressor